MSYVKPGDVDSPKNRWRLRRVLYDGGERQWSAAEGQWEDDGLWGDALAIRWNGSTGAEIGNPQSRGLATWFIIPAALENAVRSAITNLPAPGSKPAGKGGPHPLSPGRREEPPTSGP